jgi:hypothetical protein
MKRYCLCITVIAFLLFSCSKTKQGDLLEIPIDIDQNASLPLSEIAEEITAIELELTDESVINPDYIQRVIISENEVFIATLDRLFVFNKAGKFIRTIGSQGQGPGEYTKIHHLALDKKNKRLLITSYSGKIISYDLNGNFLKEKSLPDVFIDDINYINDELLLLANNTNSDSKEVYSRATVYQLNDDFQFVDSCTVMDLFQGSSFISVLVNEGLILKGNKSVYLYYGDFFIRDNAAEKVLRDTLYRFDHNRLIPELKLKLKNDESSKFIQLYNIYRSARYIFASYHRNNNFTHEYYFCYDTKSGKGYNLQNKYTDDIHQIEDPIRIRPFNLDTEMFYYLHTRTKPDDLEEPNPTLYIGKLKK